MVLSEIPTEGELRRELTEILPPETANKYFRQVAKYSNKRRRAEWLAVRLVVAHKYPETYISYNSYGQPLLYGSPIKLSISHAAHKVAVFFTEVGQPGIDIQEIKENIAKLAHKFVSDEETQSLPAKEKHKALNLIWSAKECLYKIHGKKELDFKKHLLIAPFKLQEKGILQGHIDKNNKKNITLKYIFHENYVIVWGTQK